MAGEKEFGTLYDSEEAPYSQEGQRKIKVGTCESSAAASLLDVEDISIVFDSK